MFVILVNLTFQLKDSTNFLQKYSVSLAILENIPNYCKKNNLTACTVCRYLAETTKFLRYHEVYFFFQVSR